MQLLTGIFTSIIFLALIIITIRWRQSTFKSIYNQYAEKPNSYTLVIDNENKIYGIILAPETAEPFTEEQLDLSLFNVKAGSSAINLKKTYFCDIDGNLISLGQAESSQQIHIFIVLQDKTDNSKEFNLTITHPLFTSAITTKNESLKKAE